MTPKLRLPGISLRMGPQNLLEVRPAQTFDSPICGTDSHQAAPGLVFLALIPPLSLLGSVNSAEWMLGSVWAPEGLNHPAAPPSGEQQHCMQAASSEGEPLVSRRISPAE